MQIKYFILAISIMLIYSCKKEVEGSDYEYHAHIESPNNSNKKVGDVLDININFESHAGLPVHHINVKVYNKDTKEEIYNMPTEDHIHATSGKHNHKGKVTLSKAGTYILEAKVWGEEDGKGEVIEKVEFIVK
jgi:hypothetical protein